MSRHEKNDELKGVILLGGKSTRMGSNKFSLEYDGRTLLERMYDKLDGVGLETYLSCAFQQKSILDSQYKLIFDEHAEEGPLSGILSAMQHLKSAVLIMAIDYPFVKEETILKLIQSRNIDKQATLFYLPNSKEWPCLCCIIEQSSLSSLQDFFSKGGRSVRRFLSTLDFETLTFDKAEFFNLNTREDYNKLISGWLFYT